MNPEATAPAPEGDTWLQTATGGWVYLDRPDPAAVRLEDIAHALARLCRFGGHVAVEHYSVAQHSLWVSRLCHPDHALIGLLHDAAEAYLGDVIRPLKRLMPEYKALERSWELAIGERFGLGDQLATLPPDVKRADEVMLATECRDFMGDGPDHRRWNMKHEPMPARLTPLGPAGARLAFLTRFYELTEPAAAESGEDR